MSHHIFILSGVDFAQEDLANSLVKAITSNLAATTFYVARSENMKYICFCGSFIGGSSLMTEVILKQLKDASMILQVGRHSNMVTCVLPGSLCLFLLLFFFQAFHAHYAYLEGS